MLQELCYGMCSAEGKPWFACFHSPVSNLHLLHAVPVLRGSDFVPSPPGSSELPNQFEIRPQASFKSGCISVWLRPLQRNRGVPDGKNSGLNILLRGPGCSCLDWTRCCSTECRSAGVSNRCLNVSYCNQELVQWVRCSTLCVACYALYSLSAHTGKYSGK